MSFSSFVNAFAAPGATPGAGVDLSVVDAGGMLWVSPSKSTTSFWSAWAHRAKDSAAPNPEQSVRIINALVIGKRIMVDASFFKPPEIASALTRDLAGNHLEQVAKRNFVCGR